MSKRKRKRRDGELMPNIVLMPLPRGCVAEIRDLDLRAHRKVVGCPWCGAGFLKSEYREWLRGQGLVITHRIASGPRQLVALGKTALEVVGVCDSSGLPIVREPNRHVQFHLAVPEQMITELKN